MGKAEYHMNDINHKVNELKITDLWTFEMCLLVSPLFLPGGLSDKNYILIVSIDHQLRFPPFIRKLNVYQKLKPFISFYFTIDEQERFILPVI